MQFSAGQISEFVNGRVEGDEQTLVTRVDKIEEATAGALSFLANPKYESYLYKTKASVVIIAEDLVLEEAVASTLIRVKNPYSSFSILLNQFGNSAKKTGIESPSFIHPTAKIGQDVYVGAFAYIGENSIIQDGSQIYPHAYIGDNVLLGEGSTIYAGAKIYHDCKIGKNVIIHSGAVIGSDGFGFAPQEDGSYKKIKQTGNVLLEDDVEVGANTTIDRATMGSTIIRKGVKLDNLIQLAHNVEVGINTVIAAQSGVSGSSKIGKQVILGGQVGIVGHIDIADGSQVQAKSGINRSILEKGKKWAGAPALPYQKELRIHVLATRLPEFERRIIELENKLKTTTL